MWLHLLCSMDVCVSVCVYMRVRVYLYVYLCSKFVDTQEQPSQAEILRMATEIAAPLVLPVHPLLTSTPK